MHDARAVSNFILDRASKSGIALTVMTLLKVLYFAHGWYLAKTNNPLIAQPFEAWKHGPVNRVVYDQYKEYGRKPIDKAAVSFDPVLMKYVKTPHSFDTDTSRLLENICDYYVRFHPYTLSELTHQAGGPWDTIWTMAQDRAVP